jgi:hypothetical protein
MKQTHCTNPTCGKELKHTKGRRPKKYCNESCRNGHYKVLFPAKKKETVVGMIELPADFINVEKVAIIRADGTIEELKTASQLPQSVYASMLAMKELQKAVDPKSKTSSGLVVEFHQNDSKLNPAPPGEKQSDTLHEDKKAEIQALIDAVRKEKIPDHRNTAIGKKAWQQEQDKKVAELRKQLTGDGI